MTIVVLLPAGRFRLVARRVGFAALDGSLGVAACTLGDERIVTGRGRSIAGVEEGFDVLRGEPSLEVPAGPPAQEVVDVEHPGVGDRRGVRVERRAPVHLREAHQVLAKFAREYRVLLPEPPRE